VRRVRVGAVGVIAALVGGVAVGIVARVLMRAVTVAAGNEGEFTLGGSLFIVLIYAVAMIPGGVVAAMTTRWWRWLVAAGGSIFLFFPAVGVASEEIGSTNGLSLLRWVFLVITSLAVFATIVIVALVTVGLVDRWTSPAPANRAELVDA
jgi:peptidoglycan/LPS O-acetylase OafA/YrhL